MLRSIQFSRFSVFVLLSFLPECVDGRKLLVFSVINSRSHMLSNARIADVLSAAGHDVTLLQVQCVIGVTELQVAKLAKVVNVGRVTEESAASQMKAHKAFIDSIFNPRLLDSYHGIIRFMKIMTDVCEVVLKENSDTIEALRRERFEAIFVEQLFPCGNALAHVLGIPVHFLVNSCPINDHIAYLFGHAMPLGYVPANSELSLTDSMTFLERAWNSFSYLLSVSSYKSGYAHTTALFRKYYGDDFPEVEDLLRDRTPLQFVASSEFIDFPRPVTHNVVYVGGLGMRRSAANNSLSNELEQQMRRGKRGVVFFSLGTNVYSSALPLSFKHHILDAFAAFPDWHFVVKLEKDDEAGLQYARSKPNVFVTHWVPQAVLLTHPRLVLFVTHGGYNSLLEVAVSGKPVLLVPMMFDQLRNAKVVERNGWGRTVTRFELNASSNELRNVLADMLKNPKYQQGAKRIQHLLRTKPFSADELFLKNVEFALDNDGRLPELTPISPQLSIVQQFNLDVFLAVFTFLVVLAVTTIVALYFLSRCIVGLRRSKRSKVE